MGNPRLLSGVREQCARNISHHLPFISTLCVPVMPPRKHVAKSQEYVYKQLGKGSRQTYKLVAQRIVQTQGTSSVSDGLEAEPLPKSVPIVSSPAANDVPESSISDMQYFAEDYTPRKGRSGKVNI